MRNLISGGEKIAWAERLRCCFAGGRGSTHFDRFICAVDDLDISIFRNEVLGLIGESGSGKTTLAKALVRLLEPTSGAVYFEGMDITRLKKDELREKRCDMQMVFQNPDISLNPLMKVEEIIGRPLSIHRRVTDGKERLKKVKALLQTVGLSPDHWSRYPHEFSGGQRQRIGIARALGLNPRFLILDEPTSALDVSVQAEILNLLLRIKKELGLTYLFISHDLSVIRHVSTRIAVMYYGSLVEAAPTEEMMSHIYHPYTRMLFAASPTLEPRREKGKASPALITDQDGVYEVQTGCKFYIRCNLRLEECRRQKPPWVAIADSHYVACHRIARENPGSSADDFSYPSGRQRTLPRTRIRVSHRSFFPPGARSGRDVPSFTHLIK